VSRDAGGRAALLGHVDELVVVDVGDQRFCTFDWPPLGAAFFVRSAVPRGIDLGGGSEA
jgi:hypothetical protein